MTGESSRFAAERGREVGGERLELDREEFPRLASLLSGPDRELVADELNRLVELYRRPRAERWRVDLLARLVYIESGGALRAEPAMVEDISLTGVRLSVKRSTRLELIALSAARVQLLSSSNNEEHLVDIPSWFVRVAAVSEPSVSLAFKFAALDDEQAETLLQIKESFDAR